MISDFATTLCAISAKVTGNVAKLLLAQKPKEKEKESIIRIKEGAACKAYYEDNTLAFKIEWMRLLDRSVFLADSIKLGKIEAVNQYHVVVKRGSLRAKRYYFRIEMLKKKQSDNDSYDYEEDGLLFLDLTFGEAGLYESKRIPNPCRYVTLGTSCLGYLPRPYSRLNQED